ncbi:MAG: hypothetical protein HZA66_20645 [Rhodopseudomonas palustris]|uniref:Uncharacterized protein n=1 Tax=Rhodopseudomonas palustris TaxID=1076 RepID=A0A933W2S1_RHOPL|nr:hypothetical protein [Rhodopseudomonas palustris]
MRRALHRPHRLVPKGPINDPLPTQPTDREGRQGDGEVTPRPDFARKKSRAGNRTMIRHLRRQRIMPGRVPGIPVLLTAVTQKHVMTGAGHDVLFAERTIDQAAPTPYA